MSDQKRPYRKKRRAELEEATRRRITESAVELHGSVGPSHTSMSAVAERAGVRRSTLYRHFPDEGALFEACSAHWAAANPPPDLAGWAAIANPDERLRTAVAELYAYWRRTEPMISNGFRPMRSTNMIAGMVARMLTNPVSTLMRRAHCSVAPAAFHKISPK